MSIHFPVCQKVTARLRLIPIGHDMPTLFNSCMKFGDRKLSAYDAEASFLVTESRRPC